jgi:hypothetical protein
MSLEIGLYDLPASEELLAESNDVAPTPQISQEVLQGVAYRLRTLPASEELLAESNDVAPTPQISQEVLQGVAYRLRTLP